MNTIRARIRNGRIETDVPLDLPEGSRLLVVPELGDRVGDDDDLQADTPEAIARWLDWYDALEPLILSKDEKRAWAEDRTA